MIISNNNLIWIDLEMTGLNIEHDLIIEIATLITDINLNILAEGPVIAIYQSDQKLSIMNNWNFDIHTNSGLIKRIQLSKYDNKIAEQETINFLKQWVPPNVSPICGNSICQDRRFLFKYMPKLEAYFHYRYLDVSTLKELAKLWKPQIMPGFKKLSNHCALDDIRESVAELIYYREHFLQL
ncbi:oligoribonuclease [Pantoea sp. Mhis]|uniref:oligoribonuclease n=1 Tax=Pantoea sp. Mhis TaxID=2576759 RepID=UPI0013590EF4|nr:oligoribonuclease [Pantoea sp. Mhis]MXP56375.1 oligoribonuclease [Pantoea sp. Mhis]